MKKTLLLLTSAAFALCLSASAQVARLNKASNLHEISPKSSSTLVQLTKIDRVSSSAVAALKGEAKQNAISQKATVAKVERSQVASLSVSHVPFKSYATMMYYTRPEGTFYETFSATNGNDYCYLVFPNFTDLLYKNMSSEEIKPKTIWSYNGERVDGNEDNDLEEWYRIPSGRLYYTPTLQTKTDEFNIGDGHDYAQVGAITTDSITEFHKWDIVQGGNYSGYTDGSYGFGTGTTTFDFDGDGVKEEVYSNGVVEIFDKPARPLYLTSIEIFATSNQVEPEDMLKNDASLTVEVYPVVTDEEGSWDLADEPIATMELNNECITYSGSYSSGDGSYALFDVAPTYIDDFGTETTVPLILDERFAIVITGFDNEDVDLGLRFGDAAEASYDFENMYPTFERYYSVEDNSYKGMLRAYGTSNGTPYCYNAVIYLNGMFDVADLYSEEYASLVAPAEGGIIETEAEFQDEETGQMYHDNVIMLFTELPWESTWEENEGEDNYFIVVDDEDEEAEFPDWIKWTGFGDQYYSDYMIHILQFTADPLPEDMTGRKAKIRIVSDKGADTGVITIIQGEVSDEPEPEKEITDGKYYLMNVASARCWGSGNSWGTQASLVKHPEYVTLLKQPDGTYFLESQVSNGGNAIYFEGDYMDNGNPKALVITKLEEPIGYADDEETKPVWAYTIANTDGQYYGYDGTSTVLGKNIDITTEDGLERAIWIIASEEEALEGLKSATVEDNMDATFLILDPNFGRNNRNYNAWTFEAANKNNAGDNSNFCVESYHSEFTMSQTVENVPNGVYKMVAQGFYRQDGEDNENLPVFFINDVTSTFPLKTGNENSMANASVSFSSGLYTCEPMYVEVKDNTITVGAKLEGNTSLWCIWDNFELYYYGADATIDQAKAASLVEELYSLQDRAIELLEQVDNEIVKAALEEAISEAAETSPADGEEAVKAAIAKLSAAVDAAEGNVIAKDVIPAMKNLVDQTNVYTEEALNEYFTQWYEKYMNGTITKVEASALQNPDVVTGWHAAITVDNFLLSAWDTNPDFVDAPYYINTWSVEGDNDGSNFRVPFFEYWTGDGDSLGQRELTATMENLEPGNYDVTALVRVRTKDNTGSYTQGEGIFLQVNDGTPVDVSKGDKKFDAGKDNNFFLGEFTATGTVGADGVLKIKFNVTGENNVSWLSFKNVMFVKGAAADDPELEAPEGWISEIQNGNLAGEDVSNYFSKEAPATAVSPSVITAGAGKNGSRGIVVKSADNPSEAWDSQFFIRVNETLPEGTQLHVEFDYMASQAAKVTTQSHGEPGAYKHWAMIGDVNFTTEWQHFSADVNVEGAMGDMQTIAFNLSEEQTATEYHFDNFGIWIKKPAVIDDWVNILANSDMEGTDVSCFFKTEQGVGGPMPAEITDGIGVDGSRAIAVQSADGPTNNWDTQFFVRLPKSLPAGTKYKVEFDYKADQEGDFETQSHTEPGSYIHWDMIGTGKFTTEWQHFEKQGSITADQSPADKEMQTIAFNLALNKVATQFIFDNVTFSVEESYYQTGIRELFNNARTAESIFNLSGQKVEKTSKGLYIINGKKVLVK